MKKYMIAMPLSMNYVRVHTIQSWVSKNAHHSLTILYRSGGMVSICGSVPRFGLPQILEQRTMKRVMLMPGLLSVANNTLPCLLNTLLFEYGLSSSSKWHDNLRALISPNLVK
jgi:hypothetical protein